MEVPILNVFKSYQEDSGLKLISGLYRDFQDIKLSNTEHIKQKWEREANTVMSNETWLKHSAFQWKISSLEMFWLEVPQQIFHTT